MINLKHPEFVSGLLEEIGEVAKQELPDSSLSFQDFMSFYKDGNRTRYEKAYFHRRKKLLVSAIDAMIHPEDQEVIDRLEEVIFQILQEYTWALPAHIGKQPSNAEAVKTCIDLFAAETGQALSEIVYRLKDHLSPILVSWVISEINQRIIQPFERQSWDWEYKENNWSAVIAGCLGMIILRIVDESDQRKQLLDRLDHAFKSFLLGFGDDGVCVEGVSYWAYGFGYYIYFANMLEEITGSSKYFDLPKVKAIATFPFRSQISKESFLPFGDDGQLVIPSGLLCFIKKRLGIPIPEVTSIGALNDDNCYRFAPLLFTLEHSEPISNRGIQDQMIHFFPDSQWLVVRNHTKNLCFAARGGHNNESHNHNDLGHFIYGSLAQLAITDLGAGEYTKDYFDDEKRYDYFVTSARSHAIPEINGQLQAAGPYQAQVVSYKQNQEEVVFVLDLTSAYPFKAKLTLFHRTFQLNLMNASLTLVDRFQFSSAQNKITENFITLEQPITVDANHVNIGQVSLILPEKSQLLTESYIHHNGEEKKAYLIQNSFDVQTNFEFRCHFLLNMKGGEA